MCDLGLGNKKEATQWFLKHHPDKGGEPTSADLGEVGLCLRNKSFCTRKSSGLRAPPPSAASAASASSRASGLPVPTATRKVHRSAAKRDISRIFERVHQKSAPRDAPEQVREVAYEPNGRQLQCIRQVSNWSKIGPDNRFNKARFSVAQTDKLIPIASPKLEAMLQHITALDAEDMAVHGKTFKHFIFSDIKLLGYGAKIISAGMIARGFRPIIKFEKGKIVVDVPKNSDGKNFAVLSSTALWDSPFKHKLKKEILDVYNARPANIYGENCRFIILDAGFKEGIDLFDVKYVHLFEPLMTNADLTQALGRATRLCGQKGLDFVPNKGWPLLVFKYSQNIPEALHKQFKAETLFEIALQLKGLDTRMHRISKSINDVSIVAAVDQPLTQEIHKSDILPKVEVRRAASGSSASVSMERTVDTVSLGGTALSASARSLLALEDKKISGRGSMLALENKAASKRSMLALENKASTLNNTNSLNTLANSESIDDLESDPCAPRVPAGCQSGAIVPFQPSRLRSDVILPSVVMESNALVIRVPSGAAASLPASALKSGATPTTWYELRQYIMAKYKNLAWDVQEVVNKCGPPPAVGGAKKLTAAQTKAAAAAAKSKAKAAATRKAAKEAAAAKAAKTKAKGAAATKATATKKAAKKTAAEPDVSVKVKAAAAAPAAKKPEAMGQKKGGPALKLIDYTPTQAFISSYFTAASPIKGMLLWHSVGTGKTCSAIALASTQFEPLGYTIMWVTRHTLKADVWKNIFEQVCHVTIADEVEKGLLKPEDTDKRQRRLYQQWIPPMSYRQFSNVVQGKNPLYQMLKKRNGKDDPLRKTLIIIDEAHKLYSSDFKGAEKPDVGAFMAGLQNSYKTSGQDSARVLLMTATPYNETPMELMMLLNLCRSAETALPTEIGDFAAKYMDDVGNFTKEGLHDYMDAIAGQISYLNREADPSQFAQPIFADIVVPISTYADAGAGDTDEMIALRQEAEELKAEQATLVEQTIPYLDAEIAKIMPAMNAHLEQCEVDFQGKPRDLKDCVKRVTQKYKAGLKLEERNLREARKRADKITSQYEKMTRKISKLGVVARKKGLASMTQQGQLENRCKIGIVPKA